MYPVQSSPSDDFLFVGMNRKPRRSSVEFAIDQDLPLRLYGPRWHNHPIAASRVLAERIANEELQNYYALAGCVLNDHWDDMRREGFISNRVFDVLACGVPLISDDVAGLPKDLQEWINIYSDSNSFAQCVDAVRHESDERRATRRAFAEYMREHHSFDTRAIQIEEMAFRIRA